MNKHLGSTLDDLLQEEGVLAEVTLMAKKRALALQLEKALKSRRLKKSELADRLGTSRAQVDRVLDPSNGAVTLKTLVRVGAELGLELEVSFVQRRTRRHRPARAPTAGS